MKCVLIDSFDRLKLNGFIYWITIPLFEQTGSDCLDEQFKSLWGVTLLVYVNLKTEHYFNRYGHHRAISSELQFGSNRVFFLPSCLTSDEDKRSPNVIKWRARYRVRFKDKQRTASLAKLRTASNSVREFWACAGSSDPKHTFLFHFLVHRCFNSDAWNLRFTQTRNFARTTAPWQKQSKQSEFCVFSWMSFKVIRRNLAMGFKYCILWWSAYLSSHHLMMWNGTSPSYTRAQTWNKAGRSAVLGFPLRQYAKFPKLKMSIFRSHSPECFSNCSRPRITFLNWIGSRWYDNELFLTYFA